MKNSNQTGFWCLLIIVIFAVWLYPKNNILSHIMYLFDENNIVANFRSFDSIWPINALEAPAKKYLYRKGTKLDLPKNFIFNGYVYETRKFLEDSWTTGFLVIQNDNIVFENYYLGNTASTRNISWSIAKSFISALVGIAVKEEHIKNISQKVEAYVPELVGSSYEGVRIKDVLQMSTGVKFNEDYGDIHSDINRWGKGFALGHSQDAFAATLGRQFEPGTVNHYVSINTHVLGMILTRATGKSITSYMQEKLYNPMGMEHNGYWLVDGIGMEMALGGLNLTMRDYAKIGTLYLKKGYMNGKQIIPKKWVKSSITPDAPHIKPGNEFGYGYQWWIPKGDDGEFMAIGVYNQNIYINPKTNTVIVKLSANPKYNDASYVPSSDYAALELYRAIVASMPIIKKRVKFKF